LAGRLFVRNQVNWIATSPREEAILTKLIDDERRKTAEIWRLPLSGYSWRRKRFYVDRAAVQD
jgi:hypothetical protein